MDIKQFMKREAFLIAEV